MQPVAAAFYGWLLLEEIISPMQAIGGMIVLLAIYAASRKD
jgi:drug/metabolite transporter (DMT)-like permease